MNKSIWTHVVLKEVHPRDFSVLQRTKFEDNGSEVMTASDKRVVFKKVSEICILVQRDALPNCNGLKNTASATHFASEINGSRQCVAWVEMYPRNVSSAATNRMRIGTRRFWTRSSHAPLKKRIRNTCLLKKSLSKAQRFKTNRYPPVSLYK